VQLENHSYIFTKDIIFRFRVKEHLDTGKEVDQNEMILLHGVKYPVYINDVI